MSNDDEQADEEPDDDSLDDPDSSSTEEDSEEVGLDADAEAARQEERVDESTSSAPVDTEATEGNLTPEQSRHVQVRLKQIRDAGYGATADMAEREEVPGFAARQNRLAEVAKEKAESRAALLKQYPSMETKKDRKG